MWKYDIGVDYEERMREREVSRECKQVIVVCAFCFMRPAYWLERNKFNKRLHPARDVPAYDIGDDRWTWIYLLSVYVTSPHAAPNSRFMTS